MRAARRRFGRPDKPSPVVGGVRITPAHRRVLAELASWPEGQGGVAVVMPGGLLAALVKAGLATRTEGDRIGGQRYAVTTAGQALLLSSASRSVGEL